ncbi:hypothetical protein, partial [Luedemannella flava]|uniref:hypothetical protein n=1 Tax=Luedemannella flava TaxID=349316 RepID=UPI0031E08023
LPVAGSAATGMAFVPARVPHVEFGNVAINYPGLPVAGGPPAQEPGPGAGMLPATGSLPTLGTTDMTRNGLMKRPPRATAPVRSTQPEPEVSATDGRSPDGIRSMLTAFRSGMDRGTAHRDEADRVTTSEYPWRNLT